MGPFFENNPWARQSFNQAMSCLQTGRQLEMMGSLVAAGPYYHQSLCALAACTQMLGPVVPDEVYYWMSFCQVRLGFLTQAAGNPVWAQEWLRQALVSAQTAWQRNPTNPWYQLASTQLALALGEVQQAQHYCQQPGNLPPLVRVSQVLRQLTRPGPAASGAENNLAGKVNDWLKVGGKALDILTALIKLVGGSASGQGVPAMPGSHDMGMGWMGGLDGMNMGGWMSGM